MFKVSESLKRLDIVCSFDILPHGHAFFSALHTSDKSFSFHHYFKLWWFLSLLHSRNIKYSNKKWGQPDKVTWLFVVHAYQYTRLIKGSHKMELIFYSLVSWLDSTYVQIVLCGRSDAHPLACSNALSKRKKMLHEKMWLCRWWCRWWCNHNLFQRMITSSKNYVKIIHSKMR